MKNIKKYKTILCITPVKHLEGVYEEMSKYGNIIYKPNIKESQLLTTLSKNKNINIIYCNRNRQNFRLEKTNLEKSSIKAKECLPKRMWESGTNKGQITRKCARFASGALSKLKSSEAKTKTYVHESVLFTK